MAMTIKLMADYGGTVLWGGDADNIGDIDPDTLPLSSDLKEALRSWADAYDRTLNDEYPPDSGFTSPADEDAFEAEGLRLWNELKSQLGPDYKVIYYSWRDGK